MTPSSHSMLLGRALRERHETVPVRGDQRRRDQQHSRRGVAPPAHQLHGTGSSRSGPRERIRDSANAGASTMPIAAAKMNSGTSRPRRERAVETAPLENPAVSADAGGETRADAERPNSGRCCHRSIAMPPSNTAGHMPPSPTAHGGHRESAGQKISGRRPPMLGSEKPSAPLTKITANTQIHR